MTDPGLRERLQKIGEEGYKKGYAKARERGYSEESSRYYAESFAEVSVRGFARGYAKGFAESRMGGIKTVLATRFGALTPTVTKALDKKVEERTDKAECDRLFDLAVNCVSLEQFERDL